MILMNISIIMVVQLYPTLLWLQMVSSEFLEHISPEIKRVEQQEEQNDDDDDDDCVTG